METDINRCENVMCHVWVFGHNPSGNCPSCHHPGTPLTSEQRADFMMLWHRTNRNGLTNREWGETNIGGER